MPETLSEVFARLLASARKTGRRDDVEPDSADEADEPAPSEGGDTSPAE